MRITAVLDFSRWRPSAILDIKKFKILTAHTLRRAKMHHRDKFCANWSMMCRDRHFRFFKMAAVRYLGFLKDGNFNCPYPSEVQNASSYQILWRSVEPLQRYGRLQFFKMAAVRHLGFVIRVFWPPTKCILVVSVTVQNLVWIGSPDSVVSIICKF